MTRKIKRVLNLLTIVFFCSLLSVGIFSTMSNTYTDLEDLDQYEGIIIYKGLTDHKSTVSGKTKMTSKVFYFRLKGLDQILASYNNEQSYDYLNSKLRLGDKVKVYYTYSHDSEKLNLNTYQIEKEGKVLLCQHEFKKKELTGGIICIIGFVLILLLGYFQDSKLRSKKKMKV